MPELNSELPRQIFESLYHYPSEVAHPFVAAGFLAAAGIASYSLYHTYQKTEEQPGEENSNLDQLNKSIPEDDEAAKKADRDERLMPTMFTYIGAGLAAATLFGGINFNSETANNSSNVVIVKDVSNSMALPKDLDGGRTRLEVVDDSIKSLDYRGNLAEIESAADNDVSVALSQDWRNNPSLEGAAGNDPTKGNLEPGLILAASILPKNPHNHNKREGSVVVISDGRTDSTSIDFAQAKSILQKEGVKVTVVVPGTPTGEYKDYSYSQPAKSPPEPSVFAPFGSGNILQAKTAGELKSDIEKAVKDDSKTKKPHTQYLLLLTGLGLLGFGGFKNHRQRAGRRI